MSFELAGLFARREGAVDLARLLVAGEEVADLGSCDPVGAVLRERPDVVGGGVAEAVAEDPAGARVAVGPDGECDVQVNEADGGRAVKECVEQRDPDGVSLGTGGRGAEQAGFAA
jgi:hypothetical protein